MNKERVDLLMRFLDTIARSGYQDIISDTIEELAKELGVPARVKSNELSPSK